MVGEGSFGFIASCLTPSDGQAFIALSLKRCKHLVTGGELEILVLIVIMPERKVNAAFFPSTFVPKSSDTIVWT